MVYSVCTRVPAAIGKRRMGAHAAFVFMLLSFCAAREVVSASPAVVCLHTEWLPTGEVEKGALPSILVRELGRQAVLIAARDELGLLTRDETLGEPFPELITQEKQDIAIRVRGYKDGAVRIDFAPTSEPDELKGNGGKQAKYSANAIIDLVESIEELSRTDLPKRLRGWGFDGQTLPRNENNRPTDVVENQLLEMNFVAQFAAVRAAHAAIAEKGESRGWLGVLARGYANISMMTQHHWRSDSQVFAARGLLYARRLVSADPKDPLDRAHLAYAESLVGLHGAALKELDQIDLLTKKDTGRPALPAWLDVLRPYCAFDRESLAILIPQRKSLRALTQRLLFEQTRAFGDDRWTFESAQQTVAACPDEYSVYGAIGIPGSQLGVKRLSAFSAPTVLSENLPKRIGALAEIPKEVQDAAKGVSASAPDEKRGAEGRGIARSRDHFAGIVPIVDSLRTATLSGQDNGEPSWAALGEIILEEEFVQAANYVAVAMDATESSHADEVALFLPAIRDHRYAKFIQSYEVNQRSERPEFNAIVNSVVILDPRPCMQPLMYRMWNVKDSSGREDVGWAMSEMAYRSCDLTYTQLLDAQTRLGQYWWPKVEKWQRERRAEDFRVISPRAPQTLRLAMAMVEKPTYEQAQKWRSEVGEDPKSYAALGTVFMTLEHFDDAINCFAHSVELSPSKDGYIGLANAYRANREEELWLPTLEKFFEVPALGLEHATVHSLIASDLMSRGKWSDAKPHSLEAAGTYSAWGLLSAADVHEGQQQLVESEKYIRAMSENYQTSSGHQWYFWCMRNGAGDLEKSRGPAHTYFAARNPDDDQLRRQQFLVYRVSKDDPKSAMKHAKFLFDKHNSKTAVMPTRAFYALQMAEIAEELKDDESRIKSLESARRTINLMSEENPEMSNIVRFTCTLLDRKPVSEGDEANINEYLNAPTLTESQRCGFEYLIGRAYELNDTKDKAAVYYRRALGRFLANREVATLAGIRLNALKQGAGQAAADPAAK